MKFLSRLIGAFDGLMLAVTTAILIAPFLFAVMGPAGSAAG